MADSTAKVFSVLQENGGRMDILTLFTKAELPPNDLREAIRDLAAQGVARISERIGRARGVPTELAGIHLVTLAREFRKTTSASQTPR